MLWHRSHARAHGSLLRSLATTVVVLSIAGLVALYARTVATFLRVFVQVFFEELRATPPRNARTGKSPDTEPPTPDVPDATL